MTQTFRSLFITALCLIAIACGDSETPAAEASSGDERPLANAKENIDQEHERFKEAVKPAAEKVDATAREAVGEGKKAFEKVTGEPVPDGSQGAGEAEAE